MAQSGVDLGLGQGGSNVRDLRLRGTLRDVLSCFFRSLTRRRQKDVVQRKSHSNGSRALYRQSQSLSLFPGIGKGRCRFRC